MEFLIDLLFKTDYTDLLFVLSRIIFFIVLSIVIIWLLWTILSKKMYTKNEKLPREFKLKLTFIWSLIFYYVIFSIYLFFFFKRNGIESLQWRTAEFYLAISGQLIILIAAIVIFLFKYHQLQKEIKSSN